MNPVAVSPSRLLTIEDDPVLGAYLHEQLGRCGFDVIWCQNGQEGLARAQQRFPGEASVLVLPHGGSTYPIVPE